MTTVRVAYDLELDGDDISRSPYRESAEPIGSGLENAVGVLVRAEEARRYVATTTILKRFTAATPTLLFHVLFFFSFQGMVI